MELVEVKRMKVLWKDRRELYRWKLRKDYALNDVFSNSSECFLEYKAITECEKGKNLGSL